MKLYRTDMDNLLSIPIDEDARRELDEIVEKYESNLMLQSRVEARKDNSTIVLHKHVIASYQYVQKQKKRYWYRELFKILGGTLFGLFLEGFLRSAATGKVSEVIIYVVLGFIGIILVFFGIFL